MNFGIRNLFKRGNMPEGVRGTAPSAPQMQARPPIDKLSVRRAAELLEKYKSGKAKLEARIVENEQFWKLKQWETHKKDNTAGRPSATAVLWNCIASKHADFMDGYPSPNVLPRMADDEEEAKLLSDVIPCVLRQGGFREAYDECSLEKLKQGCGIYGVFWDPDLHGGIGDIVYKSIDPLMLFWEPGKTDLQKSSNVFLCDLVDNETLKNQYPDILKDKTLSLDKNVSKYIYEDSVDTSNMSLVVDWYYKKRIGGQDVLHFAKFVGDTLLYSTENAGLPYLYAHGRYPFEPDTLHRIKGTWFGFGYIDIGKGDQTIIDELSECIVKNTKWGVKPRYLSKMGGGINEKEFADLSREIVHFEGQSTDIKPVDYKPLQGNYLAFMESKIALLKECTGNRDVNNGGTVSGVTAASGIAAMQESGSKLSRDAISGTYHAFEKVIYLTIELMREKYDSKRYFRITGDSGQAEYIEYTNALLRGQDQTVAGGTSVGLRRPEFDIIVTAEKASPYKKIERNELMMSLYGMGILQPQNAPAAMQLLSLMDFEGKERIMAKVAENGTLNDRLLQYQQLALDLATEYDPALAEEIAMAIESGMPRESAPTLKSSGKSSAESRLERVRDEAQERSQPG